MLTIHHVSKQTGISVRTLRYYEEIGLLLPIAKTEGGHRIYDENELKTLQQIVFLKTLGFKLKEIQTLINNSWEWEASLDHQLAFVAEEQKKLQQMKNAILGLKNASSIEGGLTESLIQKYIKLSSQERDKKQAFRQQIFAAAEMDLFQKLPNLNRNDPSSLEWIGLLGQLKQLRKESPEADSVQFIIKRMMEKTEVEYKGNDAFLEKMWTIRRSPHKSEQIGLYPLEEEFLHFIEQAFHIYESKKQASGKSQP
ncbi:MerR family transcriptional regulator [Lysinibacillus fusiformis]|uniref:MerR family transcriptional regulator n=1 Tax=Lysinibacillus fusiformis TaxID=28031 RepID=UPI0019672AAB|nr:MerR family transcriptional regulator [Lysinibacillus fusiformis]QSB11862.1 MerR family transcriptional regulator [Lysinibacillus fusiformis]